MSLFLALILAPLILLTFCFAVEVFAGVRALPDTAPVSSSTTAAVIVVPAHDEAAILEDRLIALKTAADGRARILLVADNCTDSTAAIARSLGVGVIERSEPERRGKGFALDFARHHLEAAPPEVVLIVDADCMISDLSIERLVARCRVSGRPCQATNLQLPSMTSSPAVQLSTFAFFVKNVVRQRGLQRLAGRAQLLGTGMAFPWAIFARAELGTDDIVEDLKLGQNLADEGYAPFFVADASVLSDAETHRNTLSQRTRWEGGFLRNAWRVGPKFLGRSLGRGDLRGAWAAIHAMIPPLALLVTIDLVALSLGAGVVWAARISPWPVFSLAGALMLCGAALVLAWRAGGSRFVTLGRLAGFPLYLAWKLPMYFGFAARGAPREWVRTGREPRNELPERHPSQP